VSFRTDQERIEQLERTVAEQDAKIADLYDQFESAIGAAAQNALAMDALQQIVLSHLKEAQRTLDAITGATAGNRAQRRGRTR
jgi:uncharacterized coiled-coil protein SlyX